MAEEIISLAELRDWARSVYGICLSEIDGGWAIHLHTSLANSADPDSALGPFPSPMAALAAGMHQFVIRLVQRAQADLNARYTAMERGGLSIYGEVQIEWNGCRTRLGTWGFQWTCGCAGGGYATEAEAIAAAISIHLAAHHPRHTTPAA